MFAYFPSKISRQDVILKLCKQDEVGPLSCSKKAKFCLYKLILHKKLSVPNPYPELLHLSPSCPHRPQQFEVLNSVTDCVKDRSSGLEGLFNFHVQEAEEL